MKFPCEECLVVAACINKERVQCRELRSYLVGKEEPQRSIGLKNYIRLFKCDGATTLDDIQYLVIKAHKSRGKAFPYYYYIIERSGLYVILRKESVMRLKNE
jgi:hypothetical protein